MLSQSLCGSSKKHPVDCSRCSNINLLLFSCLLWLNWLKVSYCACSSDGPTARVRSAVNTTRPLIYVRVAKYPYFWEGRGVTIDQQVIKITSHMFGPTDPKLRQVCDNFATKWLPVLEKCYHCYSVMYVMFGFCYTYPNIYIRTTNHYIYYMTQNKLYDFV